MKRHIRCVTSELLAAATWHHVIGEGCTKEPQVVPRIFMTNYLLYRGEGLSQSSHAAQPEIGQGDPNVAE